VLRYADARAGQHRAMRLADGGSAAGLLLAGDARRPRPGCWTCCSRAAAGRAFGRALLAASAAPPQAVAARSPQVCACFDVSEARIAAAAARLHGSADQRLQALQAATALRHPVRQLPAGAEGLLQRHPAAQGMNA
jgi:assimilatory nitrate reductase catalytic subunit